MQISYIKKKLQKLLTEKEEVVKTYGLNNGTKILRRLDQMVVATSLAEFSKLPQTRVHQLVGNRNEQISIDLMHPFRLIIRPNHEVTPRKEDGGLDWNRITDIVIIEIVDTH